MTTPHRDIVQSKGEARAFLQPTRFHEGSFVRRAEMLRPYVEGKSVLDLGCTSAFGRQDWMHAQLKSMAGELLGIDLDSDAVAKVRAAGYDVLQGDAEDLHLDRTFDVVFAGELIEHLERFPGFFDSVRRHLVPGGKLVLTTPNPFALSNFVYRFSRDVWVNSDHTCWFCEHTLPTMAERNGFVVDSISYVGHPTPGRLRAAAANTIRALLPERLRWGTLMAVLHPE